MVRNKKSRFIAGGLLSLAALLAAIYLWTSGDHSKIDGDILVEGEGILITADRFNSYKANVELAKALYDDVPTISDDELIDLLIVSDLTANQARKNGIAVSSEEIDGMISSQREMLAEAEDGDPVRVLIQQSIDQSGLTEETYWSSRETRSHYEAAMLTARWDQEMAGNHAGEPDFDRAALQRELLAEIKPKLTIRYDLLGRNDGT